MAGGSAAFPLVLASDSDDEKPQAVAPAVAPVIAAAVPGAEEEQAPAEAARDDGPSDLLPDGVEAEGYDDDDDAAVPGAEEEPQADEAARDGPSDLLPDGFEAEGYYDDDGTFRPTGYTCPITGMKFGLISEVLDYCFSNGMERALAGKQTLQDKTTLQGKYSWLRGKRGWALEIRAGEGNKKMFKFYVYKRTGIRLTSKHDVLHYMDEGELPDFVNAACDLSTEDNIIAQLEFNVNSLPPGWVKETAFRKRSDGGIRKDHNYTDPITGKVFRSLKAAKEYFASGREPEDAHVPTMSVTDMYSFDNCTDMLPCLLKRLEPEGTREEGQTSCRKKAEAGKTKRKATTGAPGSSKTPKPSRSP